MSELTLQLDSPITDEQWDAITDVNFEHTHNIWFHTKRGKDVEFVNVIRCKDCKHKHLENMVWTCPFGLPGGENFFCGYGSEPYKGEQDELRS